MRAGLWMGRSALKSSDGNLMGNIELIGEGYGKHWAKLGKYRSFNFILSEILINFCV